MRKSTTLAAQFVRRELRNRYLGSISGGLWALVQPLAQLAIYGFVWTCVFNMRAPGAAGPAGIVPFLALGVWPWNAFSEAVVRATTALQDNAALIGKVALPRWILVFSSAAASFLLHGFGFVAIVLLLRIFGLPLRLEWLPLVIVLFIPLFSLALGLALLFAAVQVFVRDLSQVLAQLMPLWMFMSPILYGRDFLPVAYRSWLDFNPFAFYPETFRALLLGHGDVSGGRILIALLLAGLSLLVGGWVFKRVESHVEDFL